MQQNTKWFSACLVLTAYLYTLSTCGNVTTQPTPPRTEPAESDEARDVDVIDMTSIMNDCNETFRTAMSDVEALNANGSFPDETDKTAKCFVRCVLEKGGAMTAGGRLVAERAPALLAAASAAATADDFRSSADACSYRNETCICERSYQFVKCVAELELGKHGTLQSG